MRRASLAPDPAHRAGSGSPKAMNYTVYLLEHIRRQTWKNVSSANAGLSMALAAIDDLAYNLARLAKVEDDHGTNFGQCSEFRDELAEYHAQICQAEQALNCLLSSIGDFVDARERHYRRL